MPQIATHLIIIFFALLVFGGITWFLLWYYFSQLKKMKGSSSPRGNADVILPIRLQAYERTILFLERITPDNLVMRIQKHDMNALQLQSELIKSIRNEFEYNLSQQLYISTAAWELVKNAKEDTIRMINIAAGKLEGSDSSSELVRLILQSMVAADKLSVTQAIEEIKKEIRKEF